jgi:asparagine synthase (glutamine-hydrolysing)
MCGLAGVAALGGELDRSAPKVGAAMAATLVHRGPDDEGCWADARVALAHRRLAILDLTRSGAQPMESGTGRYVLAFNGEIYNFEELAGRLAGAGWSRRGRSDTEVLLAAIEAWGLDRALERCDGMFAFALYDRANRRLNLVRDRCGEKPLAYGIHDGGVWFASELRAFAAVPGFDLSLCPRATAAYFRHGYVPGTATIYAAVTRVAPGEVLEVDLGGNREPRTRAYWSAPEPRDRAPGDLLDQLREQLSASVRRRLVSDRPIGALLSGGIDSSLVCALAAQHCSGALKTFTMGWDDAEYDESEQAAKVAGALGADHHDVRLGRSEVVDAAHRLGTVMDEPFADPSQLGVLLVATQARRDVVVALSGDGGDELFAGYNRHRWLLSLRRLHRRVPGWLCTTAATALRRSAPALDRATRPIPPQRRPRLVGDKARKLSAAIAAPTLPAAYQALLEQAPGIGTARPLHPDIEAAMADGDLDRALWALRVADLRGFLPDAVLTKVDRATMAVSLESRTPYLEPTLIATALQLGRADLLGPGGGKQPLRQLLADVLPGLDFSQTKAGFGVPTAGML